MLSNVVIVSIWGRHVFSLAERQVWFLLLLNGTACVVLYMRASAGAKKGR
jgi:hypothetical protein